MDIMSRSFPPVEGWFQHRQSPSLSQRQDGAASFASTLRGMAAAERARPSDAPGYNDNKVTKAFSQMPLIAPVSVDFERSTNVVPDHRQAVRDFPSTSKINSPIFDAGLMSAKTAVPIGQSVQFLNMAPSASQRTQANPARVQSITPDPELQNLSLLHRRDPHSVPKSSEDAKLHLANHLSWRTAAQDRLYLRCVAHEAQVNITVRLNGLTDREQQHLRSGIEQMVRGKGLAIDQLRITALGKE